MSFKKHFALFLTAFAANLAVADTIQLKDSASVTGKILAEKPDSVVVDVGYTVLVVPRTSIVKVSKSTDVMSPATTASNLLANVTSSQFYYSGATGAPTRGMSDLVKQIGEAVVQVRTPGG